MASSWRMNLGLVSNLRAAVVRSVSMQMSFIDCCRITFALELINWRAGILYSPGCEWSQEQIDCILTAIGTHDYV